MAGRRSSLLTAKIDLLMAVNNAWLVMVNAEVSSAGGSFWKIVRVLSHDFVFTVVACDFDTKIFVDIKRQRLVRKVLQRIHQDLCRNTNAATVLGFNIKVDFHHGFQVGSNNCQLVGFNLKRKSSRIGKTLFEPITPLIC